MRNASVRQQITELAHVLREAPHAPGATTFGPVMDLFFDLAEDLALGDLGEPLSDARIASCVTRTFRSLHPRESGPLSCRLFRIADLGFVHGAALHPNHGVAFFWFDALQQGMAAIMDLHTHETVLTRVTSPLGALAEA